MAPERERWTDEQLRTVYDAVWRHHVPGSDESGAECPADGLPMRAQLRRTAGGYSIKVYCQRCGGRALAKREDPRAAEFRPWTDAEKEALLSQGPGQAPVRCPVDGTAVRVRSDSTVSCVITRVDCWRCGNRASICR